MKPVTLSLTRWSCSALLTCAACSDEQTALGETSGSSASTSPSAPSTSGSDPTTQGPTDPTLGTSETATDPTAGSGGGTTSGEVPLALDFEPLTLEVVLQDTTDIEFLPGSMDLLLLEKAGRVHHLALRGDTVTELGQFTMPGVHNDSDCGLISLAIDPGFADNGWVYLSQCDTLHQSSVYRVTLDTESYATVPDSRVLVIREGDDQATKPWHNVGAMGFEADGETLWVLFGEKNRSVHGQDTTNNLGALLRVVPLDEGGYATASGNAFDDGTNSADIYAYGLRSPWRGILDSKGRFLVGDVGSDEFEEVDVITAPGQNLGWGNHEGFCEGGCDDGSIDPIIAIPHAAHQYQVDDEEALPVNSRVVWVGLEYVAGRDDPYDDRLDGRVVFGEMCSGYVRMLELDDDGNLVLDQHLGHLAHAPAWAQAPDGYVYAVTNGGCGAGTIGKAPTTFYRVVPRQ